MKLKYIKYGKIMERENEKKNIEGFSLHAVSTSKLVVLVKTPVNLANSLVVAKLKHNIFYF